MHLLLGVQKLVLNGQLGEAIDETYQLFPGILERNPNLLFALKVRQFIEMVANLNCSKLTDNYKSKWSWSDEAAAATASFSSAADVNNSSYKFKNGSTKSISEISEKSSNGHATTTITTYSNEEEMGKFNI